MPFFAEEIYLSIKAKDMPESIHLFDWPKADKKKISPELEEKMQKTREIVAEVLSQRAVAGIKVRQPLAKLSINNRELTKEFLEILSDEVNVKKIVYGKKIKLDTKITPKLKEEGLIREVIRNLQEMRKKIGLKPNNRILINYFGAPDLNKILEKNKKNILNETKADNIIKKEKSDTRFDLEKEIKVEQQKLFLSIKKI